MPDPIENGNGWADLDQLLGYTGNVDFPYFPGEATSVPNFAPPINAGSVQWTDFFTDVTNSNGWNDPVLDGGNLDLPNVDWTAGLDQSTSNTQVEAEQKVDDFYQHISAALGG
jgi:hypothetical protein